MANGRSMDMDDDASLEDFEGFEERNVDLSDEESEEDMESLERRDAKRVPSQFYHGPCWNSDNCNSVCKGGDKAPGGKCTRWGGKCKCDKKVVVKPIVKPVEETD
jgi:hypothetical protein